MSYDSIHVGVSDLKVHIILIARTSYKENYLKPNSDPGTLQTPVVSCKQFRLISPGE